MARQKLQSTSPWTLARRQHGVLTRRQLLELGFTSEGIDHRIACGRLHPVWRGVFAVGRPQLTGEGVWMAAVLSCGPEAILSHCTAAILWTIRKPRAGQIDVSVPLHVVRRRPGITAHRRSLTADDTTFHHGIPVTTPATTIVDIAPKLSRHELEAAINEADKLDLIDPEALRAEAGRMGSRRGTAAVRRVLDYRTFTMTDSETELRFLPIARKAGLPAPLTQRYVNDFRVDFYWPDLALIVETDGLRYHRTPAEQARDRLRDQTHTAAGLTCLRFTRAQVRFEPRHVGAVLSAVAERRRVQG
jgi:very-short-patch-repair endonuclease